MLFHLQNRVPAKCPLDAAAGAAPPMKVQGSLIHPETELMSGAH